MRKWRIVRESYYEALPSFYIHFFSWESYYDRLPTFYSTSDAHTKITIMYQISEISTNLFKMYEYPMYCKMLGVGRRSILTKKNVCKSLVEPCRSILVWFSIFSIQLRFIIVLYCRYWYYKPYCTSTVPTGTQYGRV